MDLSPIGRAAGPVLAHQIAEFVLADHREQNLADDALGMVDRRLGEPIQQRGLALDGAQVLYQLLDDLALGARGDAMDNLDQQLDQAIDDFLAALPAEGREQGVARRLRMLAQLSGGFCCGPQAIGSQAFQRQPGEQVLR